MYRYARSGKARLRASSPIVWPPACMCDRNYNDVIGSAWTKNENVLKSMYSHKPIWTRHSRQRFCRFSYAAECIVHSVLKSTGAVGRTLCVIPECLFELLIR